MKDITIQCLFEKCFTCINTDVYNEKIETNCKIYNLDILLIPIKKIIKCEYQKESNVEDIIKQCSPKNEVF